MALLFVLLQNAYKKDGDEFTHEEWVKALWKSHTGRRLSNMLPVGVTVYVANASPQVGTESSSAFKPDIEHIKNEIAATRPSVILACGKVAARAMREVGIPFIEAPHPAWRALSKADELKCKIAIVRALVGDLDDRQPAAD